MFRSRFRTWMLVVLFLASLGYSREDQPWKRRVKELVQKRLGSHTDLEKPPKNIIFFLGDGMGIPAVTVARLYNGEKLNQSYFDLPFSFEQFPYSSLIKTSSFNKHVTDSAASAVALFCGYKVDHYTLGLLPGGPQDCSANEEDLIRDGIAELALQRGLSVGFVTTDRITGATPGAMYAKGLNRRFSSDVAVEKWNVPLCRGKDMASQLLQYPANEFKVLMGGGAADLLPVPLGARNDKRDIPQEWLRLGGNRVLVNSTQSFDNLDPRRNAKVLGLFAPYRLPYHLDQTPAQQRIAPRLKELTEKAIQIMERDNPKGYFLMVEGGNIDVAEHRNQMRLASEEVLELDEAVKTARALTDPSETLVLVTSDHSHAVSLPGYMDKTHSIFENEKWDEGQRDGDPPVPGIFFAVGPGADRTIDYDPAEGKDPHFQSPAAIYADLGSHGGEDVGLWADGSFSWLFSGTIENSEVAHLINQVLCLYPDRMDCVVYSKPIQESSSYSSAPVWIAIISMLIALLSLVLSLVLAFKRR